MYTVNSGADLYIDNVLEADDHEAENVTQIPSGSNLVLGRLRVDDHDQGRRYCHVTVDYFTIWDKPLNETERNLLWEELLYFSAVIENSGNKESEKEILESVY